jgi:gliding motility-associated-like protein
MKMIKTPLFILLLCFSTALKAQYIQVNDNFTAQQLVENVLINSSCATVSNISVSGFDFGDGKSYGRFSGNGSTFPFQDGIILSTGKAISAKGPNASTLSEGPTSWLGDSDLESALSIGNSSINATVLEFDFLPLGDKISFDYIFSSEQYLSNPSAGQCSYTDGFVFLLKEANPSNAYQNLAVVPGTTIPVKTNTVRGPGTICPQANAQYFDAFNQYQHPTNFNGQTVALTAQSTVVPGTLYHIKLVVADQGNNLYDSAIFLGGGSFKIEKDLGADRLISAQNPLCEGSTLLLDATTANALSYQWLMDGDEITGATNATYNVTEAGIYTVEIELSGSCFSTGEITVEYSPKPTQINATLIQCDEDNDGFAFFNLTQATNIITANNNTLFASYFLTQDDAENDIAAIDDITNFENTQTIVYARVENQFGCFTVAEITLGVSNNTITNPDDLETCDIDSNPSDGISTFNLEDTEAEILANLPGGNVIYYTSINDALSGLNPITSPENFQNTIAFQQMIYAKLSSGIDCYGIATFNLIVNSFGSSLQDVERLLCVGSTIQLNAGNGFSSYSWNTNPVQNSQSITVSQPGTYIVTVTNANECSGTKKFIVTASSIAEVASVSVNDFQGGFNTATINLTLESIGNYQYSLDGSNYQASPTFTNLAPGQYTVYINDENCGQIEHTFYIMDYPKFFTPNQDGTNDIWRIPYLQYQPRAKVAIFDRYGKLVHFFTGSQPGWDGTLNGKNLLASDYWFLITLENGREIRGHFSLIR